MPAGFGSKKKKEELQQQMQTTHRVQQLQCWNSNTMAISITTAIHGFIRTKKCHVSPLLMNSGSLKILIEILILASPTFLGDSTSQTGQQALSMTLQDKKKEKKKSKNKEEKRKGKETLVPIDGQDHAPMTEPYHDDGDAYMVFVSSSQIFNFFF
ncbi:hypothetical protein J1N35_021874 [Gossypium stocksii]|uniref:Uncharacterized protein n=1 Tax=Gossypium stocksii TaxID=47602 RepID=A0A9D3VFN5_9ROSI|nr:hypothetical protein J1N35_021874 [Gossypium stocksii]